MMVVRQRRNRIGSDDASEATVTSGGIRIHPAVLVLVLLALLTVITVFAFSRPKTQAGNVPDWLDLIKDAEREAKEGKVNKEKEEVEEFVELWSRKGVHEKQEEKDGEGEIEEREGTEKLDKS